MEDFNLIGNKDGMAEIRLPDGSSCYVKKESLQDLLDQTAPAKADKQNMIADDQNLIRGVTPAGFEFAINKRKINDMAFIEALKKVENDDPVYVVNLFDQILGESQKQRLYEFCRESDGVVPVEKCANEFAAILKAANEASDDVKKS